MNAPLGGDQCIACQSTHVEEFAPQCFRCGLCEFTWGTGLKAHAAQQRRAKLSQLPEGERLGFAIEQLKIADQKLMAAEAALQNAMNQLGMDLIAGGGLGLGGGDMYSRTRNEAVLQGSAEMGGAFQHIEQAADAVRIPMVPPHQAADPNTTIFILDANLGSIIADLAGHSQAERLHR